MNIICINDDLLAFKDKYDFIDRAFKWNKKTNPLATFHYITPAKISLDGVRVHDLKDYEDSDCDTFREVFVPLSSVPKELEFIWLKRWIILRNFLKTNNISRALYLDNDVFLLSDTSEWPSQMLTADYTLSQGHSPHTNLINNIKALELFIEYFLDIYRLKNAEFKAVEEIFLQQQQARKPGGVGDMLLWSRFFNQGKFPNAIRDISQHFPTNETFDHNINMTEGYEKDSKNFKKITHSNGNFYIKELPLNNSIKLNSIHLQGGAKKSLFYILDIQNGQHHRAG